MPTAEDRIRTERARRYLAQLYRHLSHLRHLPHQPAGPDHTGSDHTSPDGAVRHPPQIRSVDWSDTHGTIDFGVGQLTLHATPDTLVLHVEVADEQALHHLQHAIADRVEKIGRHDRLAVSWHPPGASEPNQASSSEPPRTRWWAVNAPHLVAPSVRRHVRRRQARRTPRRAWPDQA